MALRTRTGPRAPAPYLDDFGPQVRAFAAAMRAGHGLTDREAVVLFYQCCGLTDADRAARLLCCASNTLNNHRTAIYGKLGVLSGPQAVVRSWRAFVAATAGRR